MLLACSVHSSDFIPPSPVCIMRFDMHDVHRLWFAEQGIACNNNGGFYKRGFSYGIETKLFVAATYDDARDQGGGIRSRP